MFKNRYHTDEARAKMKIARVGRTPNQGKHHTEETRAQMSAAHQGSKNHQYGKPLSEEHKAKISATLSGRHLSEEIKAKLSVINKARWQDPEYRAKMCAIHQKQCQDPEWRAKRSKLSKTLWQDPEYAQKVWEAWKAEPNRAELRLQNILDKNYPNQWKFVGDGQVNLGGRFPDFININGRKEIIELFGTYFHSVFDVAQRKEHYSQYGFRVAIIWEDELEDEDRLVKVFRKKFRQLSRSKRIEHEAIVDRRGL